MRQLSGTAVHAVVYVLLNLCFDQVSCLLDQCICGIRLFNLSMSIRFFQLGIRIGC